MDISKLYYNINIKVIINILKAKHNWGGLDLILILLKS